MAVYTPLAAEDLAALIDAYDVGALVSAKGIAEGVSNSNWLVETAGADGAGARFILTMYERRIDLGELPFFLGLLDYLSARGCPVPRTIHDRDGNASRDLAGKTVALIEFLPGISVDRPTAAQARSVGAALAGVHLAARDFPLSRANALGIAASHAALARCGAASLEGIAAGLSEAITRAAALRDRWPETLPRSVCHTDLFPDNVLMRGERVAGMIDFYFACNEAMAYDLAVTHAAWSFARDGSAFHADVGRALVEGYESVRPLTAPERRALPLLAEGACLRFVASRAEDWLEGPPGALVERKDPMAFMRRLHFYAGAGEDPFHA
ncbi:homoserine kinase [Altererythrobacter aerius]|uniref:Homoserine kinase n=1 Tax=Tsuneonella aeria TaxID=1837929 RepID=A0A6I4TE29_9SPHN|nr:homoserine kinase [Tsuneonella aeria]